MHHRAIIRCSTRSLATEIKSSQTRSDGNPLSWAVRFRCPGRTSLPRGVLMVASRQQLRTSRPSPSKAIEREAGEWVGS